MLHWNWKRASRYRLALKGVYINGENVDLTGLLGLPDGMSAYRKLVKDLESGPHNPGAAILDAAKPFLVASLFERFRTPVIIVTSQPENSRKTYELLTAWHPKADIRLFPEPDTLPYERITSDITTSLERIQVLSALAGIAGNDKQKTQAPIVIASVAAFLQKLPDIKEFFSAGHIIRKDIELDPFRLIALWQSIGYRLEEVVDIPGTISHRGGILDIFPPTSDNPARLEFFGNTVESIRSFDPATQRSVGEVDSLTVGPATEMLKPFSDDREGTEQLLKSLDLSELNPDAKDQYTHEMAMLLEKEMPADLQFYMPLFNTGNLLDYLPENGLIVLNEPSYIKIAAEDYQSRAERLREEKLEQKELPVNYPVPYFTWDEIDTKIGNRRWELAGDGFPAGTELCRPDTSPDGEDPGDAQ